MKRAISLSNGHTFRRRLVGAFVIAAVAVGLPTGAEALEIGQTGEGNGSALVAGTEHIPGGYVVPFGGGTITSLNTLSSSTCTHDPLGYLQGTYNLQVLRPLGGGQYQVLGETGNKLDPCDGQLQSYAVNIPVQAGDVLGVYAVSLWMGGMAGGSHTFSTISEPAVGDTITVTTGPFSGTVNMSATLVQPVPTTLSDCKNGGWTTLVDNSGNPFKNQGDCTSFVNGRGRP
jgi:hypothetical protein